MKVALISVNLSQPVRDTVWFALFGLVLAGLMLLAGKPFAAVAAYYLGVVLHLSAASIFVRLMRAALIIATRLRASPSPARALIPFVVASFALAVFGAWLTRVPL